MYFDTAYIAKFYFNEPESERVRDLVRRGDVIQSSAWALAEFHGVIHRRLRESTCSAAEARGLSTSFSEHIEAGLWKLIPVTDVLLRATSRLIASAPAGLFIRTGDALHLATAAQIGEREVWTNDRHMLTAAPHFGVTGRSV